MESKDVYTIIERIYNGNTYKKIFINGPWGIGKSYYANKYFEQNKESSIIYISLFGKASMNEIEDTINKEVIKKYDGIEKLFKKAGSFFRKSKPSISTPLASIDISDIGKKFLLEEYAEENEKQTILIIIDDIERKSDNVSIIDIMGLIESISLIKNIKIILIGDESNISKKEREKWENFKEKIIEKEYIIDRYSLEAIDSLIIEKISDNLDKEKLKQFITEFFEIHKIKNLRTINKGVNLFNEILDNYIDNKHDNDNNLTVFKNCLAVAIESTEKLYEIEKKDKDSDDNTNDDLFELENDIAYRIQSHYFNSTYMNLNESKILTYIINFYNTKTNENMIKDFNMDLNNLKNEEEKEKNIFFLSEEGIKKKINKMISSIQKNSYKFTTINFFIDDIFEIFKWNKSLIIGYDEKELCSLITNYLTKNYYNPNKHEYENKIDTFCMSRLESDELNSFINSYNSLIEKKYIDDKLLLVLETYKSKKFNLEYLEYFKQKLMNRNSEYCEEKFNEICKKNNYLFPCLFEEIDHNSWTWTHKIWDIYRQSMNEKAKKQLETYAKGILSNSKSNVEKYRIKALLEYKPLL